MLIEKFSERHIGPRGTEIDEMLKTIGVESVDALIDETVPANIRLKNQLNLPAPLSEYEYLKHIKSLASKNKIFRTYIGQGYYGTITPSVIIRNVLENPSWYTSYTPYQAEVSQGRLEALLNFQTAVSDFTGMEISNCSLLDEATAAAEAMIMMFNLRSREQVKNNANVLFVDNNIFPQTLDVLITRANPLGIEIIIDDFTDFEFDAKVFGALIQYPAADGTIEDYASFTERAHASNATVAVAADIMSLALLAPPAEWGADIVVGSTQRFGIPMGFGGPHAAYLACHEKFKRSMPGRIIGVTKDAQGKLALRMALQTREQHIKREKATSNICTAQALLAIMASFYAVYHGADGIKNIATRIHASAGLLATEIEKLGYSLKNNNFFDTLTIAVPQTEVLENIVKLALEKEINLWSNDVDTITLSTDETMFAADVQDVLNVFAQAAGKTAPVIGEVPAKIYFDAKHQRTSPYLTLDVFNKYRSETEMMRYIKMLERKDIGLNHSMISLGSCTMKLNAASLMLPISWPEFGAIHPFVPKNQAEGYLEMISGLEKYLSEITGFAACTLQPNSGAAGEYTGLLVIREYHLNHDGAHRNVVLIPASAHGTNPATAAMAGMKVVVVECDDLGNINVEDLKKKAEQYKENLACLMVTYPSTHGVFETAIIEMCQTIHDNGGLVYMDGANMNAQVGLTNPATIGADVCHLNLHKTFAIPHGGGGPGVGPICVNEKLKPYLPSHSIVECGGSDAITAVAAAPYGSASVLPISYGYILMLGAEGLTDATKFAILNANYLASALQKEGFKILYTGEKGRVAHEMIMDCHDFKAKADISEADIAKRLMDFGYHAPTLSFPVHGTLMIEPTESESIQELKKFMDAMITIKNEIGEVENGTADKTDNVLKNAPHTAEVVVTDEWNHAYPRTKAAYPVKWLIENKFWPSVSRVDDSYGDRNLMCSCAPIDAYRNEVN
jgi:glycine dehydrogenase